MHVQSIVERALRWPPRSAAPAGLREPPRLCGGMPVLGHTVEFVRSAIGLLRRAQQECGEVAGLSVGGRRMAAFFGPEAHEAIFRAPDEHLSPSEAYKIMTPVFGKDIVYDAPPAKMGEQVKMLLPALKDRRMRTYGETIVSEVDKSVAGWGAEGVIDLVDYCRVLTNFTSSHCLLGREFREGMTSEFAQVYHDLEGGVTPLSYLSANLPLPAFRRRDRARVRLVEMIAGIIADRRREGREGEDFLQTLMEARYSNGAALSEHEITGLLLAAIFAGHHTSSVTTAWTLIELLQQPGYLRRAVAQIDRVFGDGQPITFQSVREVPLVEYAVKEALRLHPPLFVLVRVAKQDFVFKDYHFPAGTWLLVSPTVSHRIPAYFKDPESFDPERFAPPREEDKQDFAFIPFGGGRHKCLGNAFALLQVKTILAMVLQRYEFSLYGDPITADFQGLVVGPKEPCRVRYRRRKQAQVAVAVPNVSAQEGNGVAARGCPFHASAETAPQRLRVEIDRDLCQGHAACAGEAPEVFQVSGDGRVRLLMESPPPELHEKVRAAEHYCPNRVIKIVEE